MIGFVAAVVQYCVPCTRAHIMAWVERVGEKKEARPSFCCPLLLFDLTCVAPVRFKLVLSRVLPLCNHATGVVADLSEWRLQAGDRRQADPVRKTSLFAVLGGLFAACSAAVCLARSVVPCRLRATLGATVACLLGKHVALLRLTMPATQCSLTCALPACCSLRRCLNGKQYDAYLNATTEQYMASSGGLLLSCFVSSNLPSSLCCLLSLGLLSSRFVVGCARGVERRKWALAALCLLRRARSSGTSFSASLGSFLLSLEPE